MGKRCKRKVQWRRLPLNEPPTKGLPEDGCEEDCEHEEEGSKSPPTVPSSQQRPQGLQPRRHFHPNFHPGDQRRFPPPPFDSRGPPFDRRNFSDRHQYPRYFERAFHYDQRPPFPGLRRRPFKFFGRGGFYVRGPPSYGEDGDASRQLSEEEGGLPFEDGKEEGGDEQEDGGEKPSQPVHTVLIDNEYTKIQTPRQEVIFKKSSLDRKRDSIDLGSTPSSCDSTSGCDRNSQGDQGSVAGSVEDSASSPYEEPQQESSAVEQNPYEGDSTNIFMGEPGKPPLAGVVMQQAYPGGPMISIPVHWTPFLDPGLIPGDTALTPLDPAFTHVIDPEDLPVDPAHILPVQHDSNGCPVTVQVKVNADGLPIEIEPSAFTVSLSTLEPYQQEVLLHGRSDFVSATPTAVPPQVTAPSVVNSAQLDQEKEAQPQDNCQNDGAEESRDPCLVEQRSDERENIVKSGQEHKDSEDSCSDSQYASMSESSTAPTTPSVELSESSSNSSKSRSSKSSIETCPEEDSRRASQSDSLLDSATEGGDEPCSCNSLGLSGPDTNESPVEGQCSDNHCINERISSTVRDDNHSLSDPGIQEFPSQESSTTKQESDSSTSIHPSDSQESVTSSKMNDTNKRRSKKSKKSRSLSTESSVSSQNSSFGEVKGDKASSEPVSKYQAKKSAKLLKKDKKRSKKEKNKGKKSDTNLNKASGKIDAETSTVESQENPLTESQDSTVFTTEESNTDLLRTESIEEPNLQSLPLEGEGELVLNHPENSVDLKKSDDFQISTEMDCEEEKVSSDKCEESKNSEIVKKSANTQTPRADNCVNSKTRSLESCKTEATALEVCKSKTPSEVCETKPSENSEHNPLEDAEPNSSEDTEPNPSEGAEPNLSEDTEPKTSEDAELNTTEYAELKPSEDAELKSSEDPDQKPSENAEPKPLEDAEPKPLEDAEPKPLEDAEPKPLEDAEPKPLEDAEPKPLQDSEPKLLEESQCKKDEHEETTSSPPKGEKECDEVFSNEKEEKTGDFVCKQGFVMVPILTPYYDPAILYGYPLIIPENPPERNYNRKKKKKWKKKFQEDVCLDTELYAGEPFMATPNGYIIPADPSHVCHMHGYQYLSGMFPPHMLPDEGFVSVDQSPYLPEFVPEPAYHKKPSYEEMEAYTLARFAKLYEGERKEIKEVIHEHTSSKAKKKPKDCNESCDSGVSESEELSHLTQGKVSQEDGDVDKDGSKESKKNKEKQNSPKNSKKGSEKSQGEEKEENVKSKKEGKKKSKSQKKEKGKKENIEILEPDFSSFSGPTLRFESKQDKENKEASVKQNLNKVNKSRKKKNNKETPQSEQNLNTDSPTEKEGLSEVATESISDPKSSVCNTSEEEKVTATSQTKNKKQSRVRIDSESQETETTQTQKDSTETKQNQESTSNKKSRGSRRRSKASKKGKIAKDENDVKNENENLLSTASECLTSNERLNNKLPDEDRLSLESENITLSEEWLSQESENVAASDDFLSQESEHLMSEVCLSQENENYTERGENLSQLSEVSTATSEQCPDQANEEAEEEMSDTASTVQLVQESTTLFHRSCSPSMSHATVTDTHSREAESSSERTETPTSSLVQIPSSSALEAIDESSSQNPTSSFRCNKSPSSSRKNSSTLTPSPIEEGIAEDHRSPLPEEEECNQSFRDLGVTEAVKRWIREVTPEKAFSFSQETRSLLMNSVVSPIDSEDDDDDELSYVNEDVEASDYPEQQEPKNVRGNPSVASPNETSQGACSERVAFSIFSDDMTLCRDTALSRRLKMERFRTLSSQDVFDEYDGESIISGLSRDRLYSSSSSSSLTLAPSHLEDTTNLVEDPRVYDPSVYSKYYQLGVDVHATPSSSPSTRETTLSPPPLESGSEDVDLFPDDEGPPTPTALHYMSLATELYKSQKIGSNMSHISPSLCENPLPSPHCGCSGPSLGNKVNHQREETEEAEEAEFCDKNALKNVPPCSASSSGIGSSLASTPNISPAHQPQLSPDHTNSRPKLEAYPLKNLSASEGPMPCKAVCCSVM